MVATSQPPRSAPVRNAVVAAAVLLALALGTLLGPFPASPGPGSSGDGALAERLRAAAGPGHVGLAAAVVQGGTVTTAAIGDDGHGGTVRPEMPFEIGSIAKTLTGAVLADLVRQGVVRPDDRVRDLVPERVWRPGGAGDVTLAELASHRSGLPRAGGSVETVLRGYGTSILAASPYDASPQDVLDQADAAGLSGRGEVHYSNLGVSLLGQVLAVRTGTPYPELLRAHVTGPLGMPATTVPAQGPPAGAVAGHDETGRPMGDWISAGDAPAGSGVFSTAGDMATYATAMMRGWGPGADAAAPRWDAGDLGRIGYAWYTLERSGHTLLWKNGGSGGMSSSLLVDPARGTAVVVLGNSDAQVDDVATTLLGVAPIVDAPWWAGLTSFATLSPILVAVLLPPFAGISLVTAVRGRSGPVRRSRVVGAAGTSLLFLAAAFAFGAAGWAYVPFWLAGCGLAGLGAGVAALRWPEMDPDRGTGGRGRWVAAWANVVLGVALAVAVSGVFG